MLKIILLLLVFANSTLFAKVRILTFHCNQPNFIEMQYKTLNKFLTDDFELIVFNDAKTEEYEKKIEEVCNKYAIKCVRFKPEWHLSDPLNTYLKKRLEEPTTIGIWGWNSSTPIEELAHHPSVRHCHVIQYALDNYGYDHDDIVVIFDGDNFLIKTLSIRALLDSNDIIGFNQRADPLAQQRMKGELSVPKGMEMPWVVFIAFDPRKLPNVREMQFHVDVISGHPHLPDNTISDTGAAIYKYLWKYPNLRLQTYPWQSSYTYRCFSPEELVRLQLSDRLIQFIHDIAPENVQFFVFEHFMHISAGSWEGDNSNHQNKLFHAQQFIESISPQAPLQVNEKPKVYDCFTFFNELELLEIKLNELYDYVDYFVLVESIETFRGKKKPLYFNENKHKFAKFLDKIIHVIIDERIENADYWDRETHQRNQLLRGLTDCRNDDIVIIEDLDEIISASKLSEFIKLISSNQMQYVTCAQTLYTYFLNRKGHIGYDKEHWLGSVITKYEEIKRLGPQGIRLIRSWDTALAAGWHFTYMGGVNRVRLKLESFSHWELDNEEYKKSERILKEVESLKLVEIDETYPQFVRDNIPYFKGLGFID